MLPEDWCFEDFDACLGEGEDDHGCDDPPPPPDDCEQQFVDCLDAGIPPEVCEEVLVGCHPDYPGPMGPMG